jgi:histidinol-phosphate aminotransferase
VNKKVNVKDMVQPHLRTPKGYDGIRSLEAMAADAGIPPDKIIRLNGNENSYGPSPKVATALASYGNYNRYPDPQQREIKKALSEYTGSPQERIVAGNGSDEMIDLVMRLFVGPGDNIIEPVPTFGMYRFSARLIPAEVVQVKRDKNFELDVEAIALAKNEKTKIIFIAHPNNPTGNAPSESQIRALLELGVIVVVDEAYYEYCGRSFIGLLDEYPNLIIFRTFSKWAGLAGLRVGMGVMDPEIARLMMTIKPPYNMNVAAEVALKASLEDKELLMSRITPVIKERERMFDLIKKIPGVTPIPSQANFMMVRLPKGRGVEIYQSLARKGVFVRYYQDNDMADCLRVSVGQGWETDGFVKALREAVTGK